MYGTTEQVIREHYEDLSREAAKVRPAPTEREDHEARPYVVRDLSWELARFLETQDFPCVRGPGLGVPPGTDG